MFRTKFAVGPSRIMGRALIGVALALAAAWAPVQAQVGTVTGVVRDAATGQPIAGAQVSIPALTIGRVANNVGRYLLPAVPTGTHTITVTYIGYGTAEAEVTVSAGGTVTQDFDIDSETIGLEGIVVTGTAGAARRREIGNSISQINESTIAAQPVTTVANILQGRTVGATVLSNGGMIGAGSTIKLRGNNSISQGNSPLIYVDGVRMRSTGLIHSDEANQQTNPIDDINPDDIERIEVIKGAAATTLYGTEAAGGVIQVFTKRGAAGAPAWSLSIDQGVNSLGHIGPSADINPTGLGLNNCNFTGNDAFPGGDPMFPADPSCPASGSWLKNGYMQRYNLSVRGGAENVNYFMSASWGDNRGVFDGAACAENVEGAVQCGADAGYTEPDQGQRSYSVRGNFSFTPVEGLDVRWNSYYSHKNVDWLPDGNNAEGMLLNIFRGGSDYTNDEDGKVLTMGVQNLNDHFVTGFNFLYSTGRIIHRLDTGLDWTRNTYYEDRPWGYFYVPLGNREVDDRTTRQLTFDYAGSWATNFGEISSSFSWGGQLYDNFSSGVNGYGDDFAGPGAKVLESGAITEAFEYNSKVTSGGFFLQEQIGFGDRLFITGGVRVDGHSAFGQDFGLAPYPKASLSYVISDESFWGGPINSLKLRAAIGESGKAPGLFAAARTWESVAGDNGQPAVTPDNLGNPNLGPERTIEMEFGFDGTALDGRVSFEATYFNQATRDALVNVRQLPSGGFVGTQLENVGEVSNKGFEFMADATVIATETIRWNLGGRWSDIRSNVVSLGGQESINLGWRNYIRVGHALPEFCHDRVQNPEAIGAPEFEEECLGPTTPVRQLGLNTSLTLADRLTFDVLGEGMYGHVLSSGTAYQNARRNVWPLCRHVANGSTPASGIDETLSALDNALCHRSHTRYGMWTQPADFFKIRAASLSYRVPEDILPETMRGLTLRVQGRNLFTFTDYEGVDPEAFEDGSAEVLFRQEYYNLPPIRSFQLSVKVDF